MRFSRIHSFIHSHSFSINLLFPYSCSCTALLHSAGLSVLQSACFVITGSAQLRAIRTRIVRTTLTTKDSTAIFLPAFELFRLGSCAIETVLDLRVDGLHQKVFCNYITFELYFIVTEFTSLPVTLNPPFKSLSLVSTNIIIIIIINLTPTLLSSIQILSR